MTTLTKKMAEDLADYLKELGVRVQYLHSEVDTLERVAILRDLRLGVFDVLVGINLLREGIDLPEVTLVAILDADKEGFLRSAWSLIQMIGRAARNISGTVIMYADTVTESMRIAIEETDRRRSTQIAYNVEHDIEPTTIVKGIRDLNERLRAVAESTVVYSSERPGEFSDADRAKVEALVARMEAEMRAAAKQLEFERAAAIRDEIQQIRLRVLQEDASIRVGRAAERAAGSRDGVDGADGKRGTTGLTGAADRARGRRTVAAAIAAGPSMEVTSVTVLPADEEPATRSVNRASTRTRSPIGCPGSATSTRTTAAGRPAGSIDRPGTGPSRRTSASAPASDRDGAATRRRISRTAKPASHSRRATMRLLSLALLVLGIVASGCSVGTRSATAAGDHAGLDLQTRTVLDERRARGPNRRSEHPRRPDQPRCRPVRARRGRRPRPHDVRTGGRNQTGSVAAVKALILGDQRSRAGSGAVRAAKRQRRIRGPRLQTPRPPRVVGSRRIDRRTPGAADRRVGCPGGGRVREHRRPRRSR